MELLIVPCGIETGLSLTSLLIVPCGIETRWRRRQRIRSRHLLIVPCGIETTDNMPLAIGGVRF